MRVIVLLTAIGLGLGGCNTISGFGQDVENTGDAVSDTANEAESEL